MGCFNSKPDDDGQNVAKAASNPLVKGAAKGPYGATAGAGANAGAGSHLAPDAVARNISTGGVTAVPGRVVWIGHSAGSDRRHVGYDMLYRVLSIYCGAGSGLVVGDVVSRCVPGRPPLRARTILVAGSQHLASVARGCSGGVLYARPGLEGKYLPDASPAACGGVCGLAATRMRASGTKTRSWRQTCNATH